VYCPLYAEAHRICHLGDVISDIFGDDLCRTSNVSAFVTAIGLPAVVSRILLLRCFRILVSFMPPPSAYAPYIARPLYSVANLGLSVTLTLKATIFTPLSNFSSFHALYVSV
jgi:hypothetical protein